MRIGLIDFDSHNFHNLALVNIRSGYIQDSTLPGIEV